MLEEDTAARAGLGRGGRIDQDHFPTGAFSLVREASDEVGPAGVRDAQGEASARHRGDAEVFEHDPIECGEACGGFNRSHRAAPRYMGAEGRQGDGCGESGDAGRSRRPPARLLAAPMKLSARRLMMKKVFGLILAACVSVAPVSAFARGGHGGGYGGHGGSYHGGYGRYYGHGGGGYYSGYYGRYGYYPYSYSYPYYVAPPTYDRPDATTSRSLLCHHLPIIPGNLD